MFERLLAEYDYAFPHELIANCPASPRDSARLLIYDRTTDAVFFDTFLNLPHYLHPRSVLVFNNTKVLPARITAYKSTGGAIHLLYLGRCGDLLQFLADHRMPLGSTLQIGDKHRLTLEKVEGSIRMFRPSFPVSSISAMLRTFGKTPIPPYIKRSLMSEDELRTEYQSVFARASGSVAAPTASLHFTNRLLDAISRAGHSVKFVTLHAGLGTFAPLSETKWDQKRLHEEMYAINSRVAAFLNRAKGDGRPIIAVGTTVVRALESSLTDNGRITSGTHGTTLFLHEKNPPRFVDQLITNFHVPRSSLLMLAASFIPRKKLFALYDAAITERFRLFSFGDGMYIR